MAIVARSLALALWAASLLATSTADQPGPGVIGSEERRPLSTGVPQYPEKARRQRIEGEVVVCYVIDPDGRIRSPFVDKTSNRMFNKAALRAIRETRYEPAAPGATNARTSSCNTYRFVLKPLAQRGQEDD